MSSPQTTTKHRAVAWTKDDPVGAEFAIVDLTPDSLQATGVAIGSAPEPYRLDYELETTRGFVTTRALLVSQGDGWVRRLELEHALAKGWGARVSQDGDLPLPDAGGDLSQFDSAVDLDLGLSPLFNTMPVLRHRIHDGRSAEDFLMLWISVPDLSIHASPQRYTHLQTWSDDERLIRFEAVGDGEDFVADVVFDADGLVLDYPGIATRIRATDGRA